MKSNYHTHTFRCLHADGTDEEYIQAALDAGFNVLGFADHAPWPFQNGYVSPIRMAVDKLPDYIASIRALREKYEGQLTLHLGLESEYFPRYHDHLLRMRDQGIEYYILGQHYVDSEEDSAYVGRDAVTDDGVRRYAEAVVRAIRTGLYAYVAHPDLFMRFREDGDFNSACMEAADMICQAAKEMHIPLEYNLGGPLSEMHGRHCGYPSAPFWQYIRRNDNPVIIGVDAHAPQELREIALWREHYTRLRDMGFTLLDHLDIEAIGG